MLVSLSQAQSPAVQVNGYHIETSFSKNKYDFFRLFECTANYRYSSSIFQNGKRKISNCTGFGNVIIYDIDNDNADVPVFTLEDARKHFLVIKSLIVTTKSHNTEKNGVVAERIRVILPLDEVISVSVDDYSAYYIHVEW